MKTDSNICPECGASSTPDQRLCKTCGTPLLLDTEGTVAVWRLGEVRPAIINGMVAEISNSLGLPVVIQPSFLDLRPSLRAGWHGMSATAFLKQVHRRSLVP